MQKLIIFTVLLLLIACGCGKAKHTKATESATEQLKARVSLYTDLYKTQADANGFIDTAECDALIETGLANPDANLIAAESAPGQWHRRHI